MKRLELPNGLTVYMADDCNVSSEDLGCFIDHFRDSRGMSHLHELQISMLDFPAIKTIHKPIQEWQRAGKRRMPKPR